jgi:uncharacterized RDD family membrane protein YckC
MTDPTTAPVTPIKHPSILRRLAIVMYDCLLIIAVSIAYGIIYIVIGKFVFSIEADSPSGLFYQFIVIGKLVFTMEADRPSGLFYQLGWLATVVGFYSYFWMKGGETTGMRAWRVKITDLNGNSPSLSQCIIRLFSSPIGWLLFFTALFDKNKQWLHDRLSKTQLLLLPKEPKKKKR